MYSPTTILLAVIIFLLYRQQSGRDFYTVEHLSYDLVFNAHPNHVSAKPGPMFAGRSESFSDFGAAKAYFDYLEGMTSGYHTVESVTHMYVVSGSCKPPPSFPKDDKFRGPRIHTTPYSDIHARRKLACEEHRMGIEHDRYVAKLRQNLSAGEEISDAPGSVVL
jgi:hypothetical protein